MSLPVEFNKPEYPITTEDQLFAIHYKVYESSPLQTTHAYALSKEDAVKKYQEWLGEHHSISAVKVNYSIWNLQNSKNNWCMICTGTKHNDQPLYKLFQG